MNLDDQIQALNLKFKQKTNTIYRPAKLGDGRGTWQSNPYIPGKVQVREQSSEGRLSKPKNVILPSDVKIKLKDGVNVRLGTDAQGRDIILGGDTSSDLSSNQDPVVAQQVSQSSQTTQGYLQTLRLVVKTGLIFSLKGWNIIVGGVYNEFTFADIGPLTAPSAGNMYYAMLAVLADLSDVEKIYSTPRLVTDLPLSAADVNECIAAMSPGSTPVWALKLIGGQTSFNQSDIDNLNGCKDLRQVVNAKGDYFFTPANTADTSGTLGDKAWDDSYEYRKTNAGWKRAALSSF